MGQTSPGLWSKQLIGQRGKLLNWFRNYGSKKEFDINLIVSQIIKFSTPNLYITFTLCSTRLKLIIANRFYCHSNDSSICFSSLIFSGLEVKLLMRTWEEGTNLWQKIISSI